MMAVLAVLCPRLGAAELPKPIFYLPLDGTTTAAIAGGSPQAKRIARPDAILTLVDLASRRFSPGKAGQCCDLAVAGLTYPCAGNFRADEGACSFWINPDFRGDDKDLVVGLFGVTDWGMLYKPAGSASLSFTTNRPDKNFYYDCSAPQIKDWQPGEWRHVAVCWSRQENSRRIYLDGKPAARAPFPFNKEVTEGTLYIGAGGSYFADRMAHGKMDEVAIWDRPLDDRVVAALYESGQQGKPLWKTESPPASAAAEVASINVVQPESPPPPAEPAPGSPPSPPRGAEPDVVVLDGWWNFLPSVDRLKELPAKGWGLAPVPGYWTANERWLGPDGKPGKGKWTGQPISALHVAYYQRTFAARPQWKSKNVLLHFDGVDGLAEIFINGRRLAWLPGYEYADYDIGSALRYDAENTLTVALDERGNAGLSGIYGGISLRVLAGPALDDLVVRPSVEKGRIGFSCDVWNVGEPAPAQLELEVTTASPSEQTVKRFTYPFQMTKADRSRPEVYGQAQRVDCEFDWPDAHLWTYDDPFLYRVQARLTSGGQAVAACPAVRFGFREFTRRGGDYLLNGKPTHLRGHQLNLDLGAIKDLKAAGMNCCELSAPSLGSRAPTGHSSSTKC